MDEHPIALQLAVLLAPSGMRIAPSIDEHPAWPRIQLGAALAGFRGRPILILDGCPPGFRPTHWEDEFGARLVGQRRGMWVIHAPLATDAIIEEAVTDSMFEAVQLSIVSIDDEDGWAPTRPGIPDGLIDGWPPGRHEVLRAHADGRELWWNRPRRVEAVLHHLRSLADVHLEHADDAELWER